MFPDCDKWLDFQTGKWLCFQTVTSCYVSRLG